LIRKPSHSARIVLRISHIAFMTQEQIRLSEEKTRQKLEVLGDPTSVKASGAR
jgi:hypothetical protein